MNVRAVIFGALIFIFTAPYFFGLIVSKFSLRWPADFFDLVVTSVLQALLSSFGAILIGAIGALGLLRMSRRWEIVALAPAVVPSIAVVLGFMTWFPEWRGLTAVVTIHAFLSGGLVAVVLARQVRGTVGASMELAWVEGASRFDVWRFGLWPALANDFRRLALSIFAASFASFSIPLLVGGSRAVNLEIAIHQAIRFDGAWDIAASLSLFQWACLLMAVFLLKESPKEATRSEGDSALRAEVGRFLGVRGAVILLLIAPTLVVSALLSGPVLGWNQLSTAGLFEFRDSFRLALQGSIVTSTLSGFFVMVILFLFAAVYPSRASRLWISGYVAPSVAITGFSTLAFGWGADPSFALDSLRISVGAALLFAPVIWRLRWEQALARLDGQVKVAMTLGASHAMIVRHVIAPSVRELVFWSGGLVAFWVWGDYAIGSMAASRPMTLALIGKGLLESYRLDAASLVILTCLIFGGASYKAFSWGGSSVAR